MTSHPTRSGRYVQDPATGRAVPRAEPEALARPGQAAPPAPPPPEAPAAAPEPEPIPAPEPKAKKPKEA